MAGKSDVYDILREGTEDFQRAPPLDKIKRVLNFPKSLKATVLGLLLGLYNLSSHSIHYGVTEARFFLFLTLARAFSSLKNDFPDSNQ